MNAANKLCNNWPTLAEVVWGETSKFHNPTAVSIKLVCSYMQANNEEIFTVTYITCIIILRTLPSHIPPIHEYSCTEL